MHPVRDGVPAPCGIRVVLVSSGAVGAGMFRMGLTEKPKEVAKKQALAAVGQVHLMRYYEDIFNTIGIKCAQVLLTLENLSNRKQHAFAPGTRLRRSSRWDASPS